MTLQNNNLSKNLLAELNPDSNKMYTTLHKKSTKQDSKYQSHQAETSLENLLKRMNQMKTL